VTTATQKLSDALGKLKWKEISPAEVCEIIVDAVADALRPIRERIAALEKEAEQRVYRGVYSTHEKYFKHNSCTHSGNLWIAIAEPTGAPPGNNWILAVRRGKDDRS
jgi:hypothetical protein